MKLCCGDTREGMRKHTPFYDLFFFFFLGRPKRQAVAQASTVTAAAGAAAAGQVLPQPLPPPPPRLAAHLREVASVLITTSSFRALI